MEQSTAVTADALDVWLPTHSTIRTLSRGPNTWTNGPSPLSVLFRKTLGEEDEFETCKKILPTYEFRSEIPPGSLVLGRYSVLPYYQELEAELKSRGSRLINSYRQHRYIANMEWYHDLSDMTPRTWFQGEWGDLPQGQYVLKGLTNSRKFQWNTHMFAATRENVPKVAMRLMDDTMIREQGVVVRQYMRFRRTGELINGLPTVNEWRVFCLNKEVISSGRYWSDLVEESDVASSLPNQARELVECALGRIDVPFVVVDVAELEDGGWMVVELNDGQMSGLSDNSAEQLYQGIAARLL